MESKTITLTPIGIVNNEILEAHHDTPWREIESEIVIDPRWQEALDGLEQFSHIWVIFYFDRIPLPDSPRIRPMRRADMPLMGRLATRTPQRPNPIGISPVPLLQLNGNRLRVRGLEALDGTPVLDIKPYVPHGDVITDARVGDWVRIMLGQDSETL
jgi:tRNA-Thr(GGU) m(6)t(6)A37 methyltransferase TsaA